MKRLILLTALALTALAAAVAPSSAKVPHGHGLVDFGVFNCEGIGQVSVFGPRGFKAASSFTTAGQHVVLLSLSITGTEGSQPFSFSKSYGKKKGLTPITCTQHVEEDGFTSDATAVVALVPPAR
jgi:hypothetical protein